MENEALCEALKEKARSIGSKPHFWEKMTAAILNGEIHGLDPRVHIKNPKTPEAICEEIHRILGYPGGPDIEPSIRALYLQIVRSVLGMLG